MAANGGIRLGRGVGPVRSGGRSVSWLGEMGYKDWRVGSAASGGIRLGRGVEPMRSGGRSMS